MNILGTLIFTLFFFESYCLFPRESITREIKSLNDIWDFKICHQTNQDEGFKQKWYKTSLRKTGDTIPMPVPSSFNDITQNRTIRDYLGWSWYEKTFYVPQRWVQNYRVVLRFESAHYYSVVYLNGENVMNHTGGHLPFEVDVTKNLQFSNLNRITVALNNTLSFDTIPQGQKSFKHKNDGPYPPGYFTQGTNFDFFNYAGIHRSVLLYAMPLAYIKDITIVTDIKNNTGYVQYIVDTSETSAEPDCNVRILDRNLLPVITIKGCSNTVSVKNPNLWWPYAMHDDPGYMYTLEVRVAWKNAEDIYNQPFGIRTVNVTKTNFLVNGKPFYFMGFGKHEDSNIRGKGLDLPIIVKDFNLIKWIGANSFRTSHYPYAEEVMNMADEQGIVVIDESPAVALSSFGDNLLKQHKAILSELIHRDKNHPSVFAWSVANEPQSSKKEADKYFSEVVAHVKELDPTRPVTAAINADYHSDKAGKYLDFVMLNHYYGWYSDVGALDVIEPLLINFMTNAFKVYKKPIMMSEYGADTVAGLHTDPPFIFTEDYQTELMMHHHKAFDVLKSQDFFIGEHIWNFADFLTLQQINRVVGNKKGIFTRERQPKASAKLLRCRYHGLSNRPIIGSIAYCPIQDADF
ncbi:beta-glucuronidase isoform X1 [Parasteatoda tepidariorum]|uniref:beta-glucuronidase isoform X1 n=2 Tax=Parasteatoda tepidariorum TaxID=114398 RepID=UPI001C725631|nr:beta-glucuronidase-like isoform X2 [Parasteatoda tepidariorum]